MNITKFITLLSFTPLLFGCSSESEKLSTDFSEKIEVSVECTAAEGFTRAITSDGLGEVVSNVQLYVFRENGDLDAYKEGGIKSPITIKITAGKREFYAVANPKSDFKEITRKSQLLSKIAKLQNENAADFTMVGYVPEQDIQKESQIEVTVKRMVACLRLQYDVDFSGVGALAASTFKPDSIYVMNANSVCSVDAIINNEPASTIISGGNDGDASVAFLRDINDGMWGETPAPIDPSDEAKYLTYFVYKNGMITENTPPKEITSIVISGEISSIPGTRQYYRIDVNTPNSNVTGDEANKKKYIQNNVVYTINAKIKGIGTIDPVVDPIAIETKVIVEAWSHINQDIDFEN